MSKELYIPDQQIVLYSLYKMSTSRITDIEIRTCISYQHICNIIKAYMNNGLVKKCGRNFYVCSEDGEKAAMFLEEYFTLAKIDVDKIIGKKAKARYHDNDIVEVMDLMDNDKDSLVNRMVEE